MIYNMRVRNEFLNIMLENNMSDNPKVSKLANLIYVEGIRSHIREAKKMKLKPREGAFYCIEMSIKEYDELTSGEKLLIGESDDFGSISNIETYQKFTMAVRMEKSRNLSRGN